MRVIIAGCGYLGLEIARNLHASKWEVIGLTHSEQSASALTDEPFLVVPCDISNRAAVENFAAEMGGEPAAVIHCASSGKGDATKYREVYLGGATNLCEGLRPLRFIFCSSTSVYAQLDGDWVTENSPAAPGRDTGKVLRETEEYTLAAGGIVARLAGIYGPGRSVLLRKFFSGEAVIEGDGRRWVNQIHRDDGASALAMLAEYGSPGIYNVADDRPSPQFEIYDWLATRFKMERPPFGPVDVNRKRGVTNKCVSNTKLRGLGWKPRYPSFYDAVESDPSMVQKAKG
jgi:nucleoside-diphosphate-sugar epimerase